MNVCTQGLDAGKVTFREGGLGVRRQRLVFAAVVGILCMAGVGGAELISTGGGLIYDTNTNLTWYQKPGPMIDWYQANDWAGTLVIEEVTGWRLPSYPNVPDYTYDPSGPTDEGEMGQLWVHSLGNTPGNYYTNADPFDPTTWPIGAFWTGEVYYNHLATLGVQYNMNNGTLTGSATVGPGYAFAVHDGYVSVPEPATVMLVGLGLAGLFSRRKRS